LCILALGCGALAPIAGRAQNVPGPLPLPNLDIAQPGVVNAVVPLPDGSLVIGGSFTTVGRLERGNLARILTDGTVDQGFDAVVSGEVRALARDPANGQLYVGGTFSAVDGIPRSRLARLDAAGNLDATWNPGAPSTVNALVFDAAAAGVIVGSATAVTAPVSRPCLVRVSRTGAGAIDTGWSSGNFGCSVRALLLNPGATQLFVAGDFTSLGGLVRPGLAKLSTLGSGAAVAAFDARVPAGNSVHVLDRAPGGRLFVGGQFESIGGATRRGLARLDPDTGTADAGWIRDLMPLVSPAVTALSASANDVVVGGFFRVTGVSGGVGVARFATADGAAVNPAWAPRVDGPVAVVARRADGAIVIGGSFARVDSGFDAALAVVATGNAAALFETAVERPGRIEALALAPSDRLVIGGRFHRIGTSRRDNLARLSLRTGELSADFAPVVAGTVSAVAVDPSTGDVFIGGPNFNVNGALRAGVARLTAQGATDPGFRADTSSAVNALHFDPAARRLYVAGLFTEIADVMQARLARLDPVTGALDQAWRPTVSGGAVLALLAVPADGTLVVGGEFTAINGQPRPGLARLFVADGAGLDTQWNPIPNGPVLAAALAGETIVVGGDFTSIGAANRNRIARLSRTGNGAATPWNPDASGAVDDVAYDPDARAIFAAGIFNSVGGRMRRDLARIDDAGAVDPDWNPGADVVGFEHRRLLHLPEADALLVGGTFSRIGGQPRRSLAALPDSADPVFDDGFE
jgi:hypothetical protein